VTKFLKYGKPVFKSEVLINFREKGNIAVYSTQLVLACCRADWYMLSFVLAYTSMLAVTVVSCLHCFLFRSGDDSCSIAVAPKWLDTIVALALRVRSVVLVAMTCMMHGRPLWIETWIDSLTHSHMNVVMLTIAVSWPHGRTEVRSRS